MAKAKEPASLGYALPIEIKRVEQLRDIYASLPVASQFVLHVYIDPALKAARDAIAAGDTVAMLRAYVALKGIAE